MSGSTAPIKGVRGLSVVIDETGAVQRIDFGDTLVNLFVGNPLDGSPTNLWLRLHTGHGLEIAPLLGPGSHTRGERVAPNRWSGSGKWQGMRYSVDLVLSQSEPAWFWHVQLSHRGPETQTFDLVYTQDIGLTTYGMARLNEYYVSQYLDHSPLQHDVRGWVVASRQNLAAAGRNPWSIIGSLRRGVAFATDALQVARRDARDRDLSSQRLQHEHSMAAIQDERIELAPQAVQQCGFFGLLSPDHPEATTARDLQHLDLLDRIPESAPPDDDQNPVSRLPSASTLFSEMPRLQCLDLDSSVLRQAFPGRWRHKETGANGDTLSFFHGVCSHVVLRAKAPHVLRPHGHLLRSGQRATPDESALTSTVWMAGVFHSMLTQGHVSFNRLLSTVHSYIGLFPSQGQRVFIDNGSGWQLLDQPSAFEMTPTYCRWLYQYRQGLVEVRSEARSDPHEMTLEIAVRAGPPIRCLVSHHIALNGDDGSDAKSVDWSREGDAVVLRPAANTAMAQRFPDGRFRIVLASPVEQVAGDELLFKDGKSRQLPFVCVVTTRGEFHRLRLQGHLIDPAPDDNEEVIDELSSLPSLEIPESRDHSQATSGLAEIMPWFVHNALIHYLSPRGLEQYSGGGWGTRDVTQGPVELLLSLGKTAAVRDVLRRVMAAQRVDGDWPQWFMFFARDRDVRAGDSHGDIVFWPLLALAQYLLATGDRGFLDEAVPYFEGGEGSVWNHVERALAVIDSRVIPGTSLAAYGHGDWNDSLQPADPSMRDTMCSSWTVTLHYQTLVTLARALRLAGRDEVANRFEVHSQAIRADFQKLLLVDGVLAGYAMFDSAAPRYLLHPRDEVTGVRFSSLAMIHAILEGLFTPEQVRAHLRLIDEKLSGPDGVRLFDRPMRYHGGPQQIFQRAESATYFGREIGLMYMHAHLRYAQALAHVGDVDAFFKALCQANPIGLRALVPSANLRQSNCYYSSSDATFPDRYVASDQYDRVANGTICLDGGWRVYSSGAGIAVSLIVRRFLGLMFEHDAVCLDPVMPASLSGLKARTNVTGHDVEFVYEAGEGGCGVSLVTVNGHAPPMNHDPNPYRKGAARIDMADFVARLGGGINRVVIRFG